MQKKVLILSYSHLKSDPRINRQIKALVDHFQVHAMGLSAPGDQRVTFDLIYKVPAFSLGRKLKRVFEFLSRNYDRYYWDDGKKAIALALKDHRYDAIIANDIHTLPLALSIANGHSKVYFDAHEYHPLEFEESLKWRLLHKKYLCYLCAKYIPQAHAFSTVSNAIAKAYEKFTGICPLVITNAAVYHDLAPSSQTGHAIRLIHHGAALRGRKLEMMVDVAKLLGDRFTTDFMLVNNDEAYMNELKALAADSSRIRFIEPVDAGNICSFTNNYDLGIYLLMPSNFNNLNALPNKVFEFVQARLGMVVSPNPEMAAMVREYGLGLVSEDYTSESMARAINALDASQVMAFKQRSHEAARVLSAEENIKKINAIVAGLVGN